VARTDDDSWDITESVGATALGAAAARAAETDRDNPLIVDPYAKLFLDAAGPGMWSMFSAGALPGEGAEVDPELPARVQAMVDYTASRTVFFDEFFLTAAAAGVRQAVILAAGLDARAWRLPWPHETIVYELDQPKVLEFKTSTLQASGAHPSASYVTVPVDLRRDWPKALQQAGFDASEPTAWSAEGLLQYLPAQAQDLLFDRVKALSAPGSRIAVETFSNDLTNDGIKPQQTQMRTYRTAAGRLHHSDIPNAEDLLYLGDRTDVADWLRGHGWEVSVAIAHELLARHHRSAPEDLEDATPCSLFVSAQRSQP
jgi:methyltransferase (TIGR00027 family)